MLVAVLHSIIHDDWTYVNTTCEIPLESINKPPPGLSTRIVGRGHLLMRGSKSNFEHVMVTVVWGKLFVQAAPKSKTAQDGCIHQPEKAFSLVNGSLAVDVDGSGRIDVVTPTHRLQFLVELSSELSHDKWLKVLAQCISIYDLDNKYFIDFGEMVRRQTKGKQAAPATVGVPRSNGADQGVPSLSGAPDQAAAATPGKRTRSDTVPCVRTSTNAEIMLAKHFLLNFSVVLLPPKGCRVSISAKEKNALGQCRAVLHLDQLRKTLEVVMKGTCVLSFKLRSIERFEVSDDEESYGAFPFLSIHYKTPTEHQVEMNVIVLHFQAFHEVEVCRDLLHNTLGGSPKQLSLQRSILRQGNLLKRGKSGIFGQRYGVLVPNKLLLLRSKTAYIPLQVVTFGNNLREWAVTRDEQDKAVVLLSPSIAAETFCSSLEEQVSSLLNHAISLKFKDPEEANDWYQHLRKLSRAREIRKTPSPESKANKVGGPRVDLPQERAEEAVEEEKEVVEAELARVEKAVEEEGDDDGRGSQATAPGVAEEAAAGSDQEEEQAAAGSDQEEEPEKRPSMSESVAKFLNLSPSSLEEENVDTGEGAAEEEAEEEEGTRPVDEERPVEEVKTQEKGGAGGRRFTRLNSRGDGKIVDKAFKFWGVKKKK